VTDNATFQDLLRRVRAGDEAAAFELVRQYEPYVRREVRLRLLDDRLRRKLDTMDVCQSVFASFFVRAALGQYDLEQPAQLLKLLAAMAHNKVVDQDVAEKRGKRDRRRVEAGDPEERRLADPDPTPSEQVAARELLDEVRKRLTAEERELADQWAQGRPWAEIAAERGESPEALRKRLSRALRRVADELGLEDLDTDHL
jgi:RNA polymerase sigma-70 factor (ECF subfamily)